MQSLGSERVREWVGPGQRLTARHQGSWGVDGIQGQLIPCFPLCIRSQGLAPLG